MASFLRTWIGTLVVLALLVVGLNLLVDPYDVFGTPRLAHISMLKPGAKNHALLAKTYQEARAHPVTVLIGSSSTHIGIDAGVAELIIEPDTHRLHGEAGRELLGAAGKRHAARAIVGVEIFEPRRPARRQPELDADAGSTAEARHHE